MLLTKLYLALFKNIKDIICTHKKAAEEEGMWAYIFLAICTFKHISQLFSYIIATWDKLSWKSDPKRTTVLKEYPEQAAEDNVTLSQRQQQELSTVFSQFRGSVVPILVLIQLFSHPLTVFFFKFYFCILFLFLNTLVYCWF